MLAYTSCNELKNVCYIIEYFYCWQGYILSTSVLKTGGTRLFQGPHKLLREKVLVKYSGYAQLFFQSISFQKNYFSFKKLAMSKNINFS